MRTYEVREQGTNKLIGLADTLTGAIAIRDRAIVAAFIVINTSEVK